MSDQIPETPANDVAAEVKPMPTTVQELHAFVTGSLNAVLNDPTNVLQLTRAFADTIVQGLAALTLQRERASKRPAVVRTEFPGSIRATVHANPQEHIEQGGEPFSVDLQHRDDNNAWVPATLDAAMTIGLSKLVLSQADLAGDQVFYIATVAQIDQAYEAVVDRQVGLAQAADEAAAEAQAEQPVTTH